jgi:hypothetical protein
MGSADFGVMYMTPLHENLCLLEELQPASTLPIPMLKNRRDHLVVNIYSSFIWQIRPKIKLGVALIGNNAFDKPMLIPMPYFQYHHEKNVEWNIMPS